MRYGFLTNKLLEVVRARVLRANDSIGSGGAANVRFFSRSQCSLRRISNKQFGGCGPGVGSGLGSFSVLIGGGHS